MHHGNAALKIEEPWPNLTEYTSDCCGVRCHAGFDSRDNYFKAYCPKCGRLVAPTGTAPGLIWP
jgi:hypothetical protein